MVARAHMYPAQCNAAAEQQPEGWRFVPDTILPGYQWAPQWVPARTPNTGARSAGRPWVARTTVQQQYSAETRQTTTQAKSWRSDAPIILPGWEHHTRGSRLTPTVHPCPLRRGGCGWLVTATQHRSNMSPNSDMVAEPLVEHSSTVSQD